MEFLTIFVRGMLMGAADVVPGVSGGTMAFITGIYGRLINAISALDVALLSDLFRLRIRAVFRRIDLRFLVPLFAGILTSVFSLARLIHSALVSHPVPVWSFFFGLILASSWVLGKNLTWHRFELLTALTFAVLAYLLVGLVPVTTPDTWWFTLLSGSLASVAMILPGISGSFILVLLSQYERILAAVHHPDPSVLVLFTTGVVLGLVGFSRILRYQLKYHRSATLAALTGLMLGSLRKIWPFKDLSGSNIMPDSLNSDSYEALIALVIGVAAVIVVEFAASRRKIHD